MGSSNGGKRGMQMQKEGLQLKVGGLTQYGPYNRGGGGGGTIIVKSVGKAQQTRELSHGRKLLGGRYRRSGHEAGR